MGKAARWLKSFLGIKKHPDKDKDKPKPAKENNSSENGRKDKVGVEGMDRRWSFTKQSKDSDKENRWFRDYNITDSNEKVQEQSRHSIAVAAASAAAADAAVAAAHAAVAVVRLTSQARPRPVLFSGGPTYKLAAVKIQTCFRGYLARKALRALRALVKLQAYVRGYLVRKRAAATLQSMQALIRAQAVATSQRMTRSFDKNHKLYSEFPHRRSIEKCEDKRCEFHSKRLSASYDACNGNYEGSPTPKIVEIDTYKPRSRSKRMNPSPRVVYDFEYPTVSSPLPCPVPHRLSMPGGPHDNYEWSFYGDEYHVSMTAHGTPRFPNSSVRCNGPATPTKSVCGDSFFPNYMADTQSFRAKLRSQSAPKQRPDSHPKKKLTLDDIIAARNSISGVRMHRSSSHQVQHNFNF